MTVEFETSTSRLAGLIIDVPAAGFDDTVAFWAAALGASAETVPGMPGGDATYVELRGASSVTDVLVQRIAATDRPRFHLDVSVADRDAAVRQAEALGGITVQREDAWDVLRDPAGLPLCLGFEDPNPVEVGERPEERSYLDALFLDVPAADVRAEVAFWTAVLGVQPAAAEGAYHPLDGVRAVGERAVTVEVQACLPDRDRDGVATVPRVHVDLSATDVAAEVDRLRGLGARHVAAIDGWVTLADPAGNLFCVVPRPAARSSPGEETH